MSSVGKIFMAIEEWDANYRIVGKEGVCEKEGSGLLLIKFDENIRGHGEGRRCWWMPITHLKEIDKWEKIDSVEEEIDLRTQIL